MWTLIVALILGTIIGWLRLVPRFLKNSIDKVMMAGLVGMLFFMGVGIGANPEILRNLNTLGMKAFIIALASVIGSIIVVWVVDKKVIEGGRK